jgi:hypothetical protein
MINDSPSFFPSKVVPTMLNLAIHPRGRLSAVAVRLALAVLVIVALLQLRFYLPRGGLPRRPPGGPPHHHPEWNWNPDKEETHGSETQDVCAPFTGLERVVITVKTGATEAAKRIPTLLQTSLRCAPHVLVFSDMAQKLGDIEIYDSLDETAAAIKDGNRDFDLYRKQQEIQDPERIATELKTMHSPEDPEDLAAWVLDKYKNTHIVEKSWALKPDMDWYLHIDADSYVVWPSLIEWIKKLDPTEEAFYGSMSYLNDVSFAHGGSGILITGAASRNFAVTHNGTAARWDPQIPNKCCGDYVLAQALLENGVGLVKHSWPTINGESQSTIPFDEEHWCRPLVTMHHVSPEEAIEMGQFEDRRPDKSVRAMHILSYNFRTTVVNIML